MGIVQSGLAAGVFVGLVGVCYFSRKKIKTLRSMEGARTGYLAASLALIVGVILVLSLLAYLW
ncbi:MAG: hypothetical protein ACR2JR_05700 [Rubrobacteraceae bacterium]